MASEGEPGGARELVISRRLRERFDYFFLGLDFAVLGLSVQTARFGNGVISDAAELIGWSLLLLSGFAGLQRLREQPDLYELGFRKRFLEMGRDLRSFVGSLDEKAADDAKRLREEMDQWRGVIERRGWIWSRIQFWGFLLGVLFEALSRALPPIAGWFGCRLR